jgi:hypothetical protein
MSDRNDSITPGRRIRALRPRDQGGFQFVFYGDCCSGVPGAPFGANFVAVNGALARLDPSPEFVLFLGDHVFGLTSDYARLRQQWRYWCDHEMAWFGRQGIPLYHTTSNHDTYDTGSEAVWREVFPGIPGNGPPAAQGLAYFVRRGPLLLVAVHTSPPSLGGPGHVEHDWLEGVLAANADARYKLVMGHYPVHSVNGYARYPLWRIPPDEGRPFWEVLVRHRVLAYFASHIIAFDAQVHDGVLQVVSGGAGTNYGPGGFMPGPPEYLHFVQAALDGQGLRYQTIDTLGAAREWLTWPLPDPPADAWEAVTSGPARTPSVPAVSPGQQTADVTLLRFSGTNAPDSAASRQTLLSGWRHEEARPTLEVAIERGEITVTLVPRPGECPQRWSGPCLAPGRDFHFDLAIHPAMGPGGILSRADEQSSWSSLGSASARGAESMALPDEWVVGSGPSGPGDVPFRGHKLTVIKSRVNIRLET